MELNVFAISGGLITLSSSTMAVAMFYFGQRWLNRLLGIFCTAVLMWGLGAFLVGTATDPIQALLFWKIGYIGVVFIPPMFTHFVYVFLERKVPLLVRASYILSGMFLFASFFSNAFFAGTHPFDGFWYLSPTALYDIFLCYFLLSTIYAHALLYFAYKHSDSGRKQQIGYFFIATFVGYLGGSFSFLPVYGINIYPYPNLCVAFYPLIMGYAILRHNLFDIRVAVAQVLIFLLWIFVGVRFIFSNSIQDFLLNGSLFVSVVILGFFLVRSVTKEVKQRERSEELAKEVEDKNGKLNEKTLELNRQLAEIEKMNKYMVDRELKMVELKKENDATKQENEALRHKLIGNDLGSAD